MSKSKVNKMDLQEFIDEGYLQEVNRLFFHPLGLALTVMADGDNSISLHSIQDYRGSNDEVTFGGNKPPSFYAKKENIESIMKVRHAERMNALGYIYEPVEKLSNGNS